MKTIPDIMKAIISGLAPRTTTGANMEVIAYHMVYDWLC